MCICCIAEPPSFIKAPEASTKVAEGQTITLVCEAFGAPDPKFTWKRYKEVDGKEKEVPMEGPPKFRINKKGHLTIRVCMNIKKLSNVLQGKMTSDVRNDLRSQVRS